MEINKNTVTKNFLWRFLERCGAQGVTFVVSIVLARILDPAVYGTIALVTVFITILQIFVDSGLSSSLIQKKNADDLDFSTVFYFNIGMCIIIYAIIFLCAPLISAFYERPDLTPVIRVLSLVIIVSGIKGVQQAYVSRNMLFKRFFFATLGGTVGAGILGIYMAVKGYGVWALVAQHLFNTTVDTMILWMTVKWRPKWLFSWSRLKSLFSFGWKILVSSLINAVYNDIRQLIIGKQYSAEDLAFYNRGKQFPNLFVTNINVAIDSVLLPTMASVQDRRERVKAMTRRAIKISTYLMAPLMMGLAACGETIVHILLTDKWLPCVPYLTIFCITFMFQPIHTANLNAIKAMGRSDLFLRLEIAKKIIGIAVLLVSMQYGVMAMAYSLLLTSITSQIINSWPNKELLDYSYFEQIKDILPGVLLAAIMGLIVWTVKFIGLNEWLTLLIQISSGITIYVVGSIIFHLESFDYLWLNITKHMKRHLENK